MSPPLVFPHLIQQQQQGGQLVSSATSSVAFDALTSQTGTGDFSFTHTPVGTPRGVLIAAVQDLGASNEALSPPRYGSMTVPWVHIAQGTGNNPTLSTSSSEDSAVYLWFLGAAIPTGAQTVKLNFNATGSTKRIYVMTLTADDDIEIVSALPYDQDASGGVNALSFASGSRTSFMVTALHHAVNAVGDITQPAGWTARNEHDFGAAVAGIYTKDTNASGTVTADFAVAANVRMAAWQVCISEVDASTSSQYASYGVWVEWEGQLGAFGSNEFAYKDLVGQSGHGVKSVRIRRGRDDALSSMRAAVATVVVHDPDGLYNPENASSPLFSYLLPMKAMLISANNGSGNQHYPVSGPHRTFGGWPLFFGAIRSIEHDPSIGAQETTFEVVGRFLQMSRYLNRADVTPDNSDYFVGGALRPLIGVGVSAIVPGGSMIFSTDGIAIPSTWTPKGKFSLAAAEELLAVDRGCFYELSNGGMAYEPRALRTGKVSVATISDTMTNMRPGVDLERIGNQVTVTRTGGEPQTAVDATSQTEYGSVDIGDIESPFLADDAAALDLAEYLVEQFATPRSPMYRLEMMNRDPETMDQILQRELQDRITIEDTRGGTSGDYIIEAIEHEITDGGKFHRCAWILSALGTGAATGHAGVITDGSGTSGDPPRTSYLESTSIAFPADPRDRDEVYVVVDDTNGVVWHFRYREGSASSYKWEFVGGPALSQTIKGNNTSASDSEGTASTTYTDLATPGPAVALPFEGDYMVQIEFNGNNGTDGGGNYMSYAIGGTAASDNDAIETFQSGAVSVTAMHSRTKRKDGLTAVTLTAKYKRNTAGTAAYWRRFMSVTPVRVSG